MALKQASRLLLVLLTAWALSGAVVLLDSGPDMAPSEILISKAYAGDPDEFSDGTTNQEEEPERDSDGNVISQFLDWVNDTIRDLF